MEWLTCIRSAIKYMEDHLQEDISVQDVGNAVHLSPMFLQKGFSVMTGYGIGEYLRNRRLYQAGLDVKNSDEKIIDIAFNYAYETPESFTKAFTRFHGYSPSQIRAGEGSIRKFLPISIRIIIHGGSELEYKIVKMTGLKVIGFARDFSLGNENEGIPKFWDDIYEKYVKNVITGQTPFVPQEQAIVDNGIGDYGICIDNSDSGDIHYIIGGKYAGGDVPDGMELYELPQGEWAVFDSIGPMPDAIQTLSDQIFKEWLPGNPEYELNGNANVEWYDGSMPDNTAADYHSQVWIPVKRKL